MSFKKVNKPTARKLYREGREIYLLPCKVNEQALEDKNFWIKPVCISLATSEETENKFDRSVNAYEYYNCCAELGYYAHYFVKEG